MSFPLNRWYVVASIEEVGGHPLARTVCGRPVVLFRGCDGAVTALDDRCPHRNYPLSLGQVLDGEIQCGYHGLRFDPRGTCVWVPGQDRVTSKADVISHALVEQGPWIWMWVGEDPTVEPDHSRLPSTPWFEDAGWTAVHGMEPLPARYGLLVDNLLDLSHETFLHAGYIGTPEVAETPITTEVDDEAGIVRVFRRMEAVECPPFYVRTTGLQTPIDRWQDIEYHAPGFYLLHVRVAPHGVVSEGDGSDLEAAHLKVLYAITPVDESNTLDFWAVCRDFALEEDEISASMAELNREVVLQDVEALAVIENVLTGEPHLGEVSFKIDTGALAARRVLARQSAAG
jgi:vanillate O-demethylase monooxygenase subunit